MDANARGSRSCKNMSVLFAFKSNFLKTKFDIFHRQVSKMGLQLNTQPQHPIPPPYMLCINMTFLKFHGCNWACQASRVGVSKKGYLHP